MRTPKPTSRQDDTRPTHHSVGDGLHHDGREDAALAGVGALPPAVVDSVVRVCQLDEGPLGKAELLLRLSRVLVHCSEEGGCSREGDGGWG